MGSVANCNGMAALLVVVATGACSMTVENVRSQRDPIAVSIDTQRILTMDTPPIIAAKTAAEIEVARRLLSRMTPESLRERSGAKIVDANALPWLSGSAEGRAFLESGPQRVLVRGRPAEICPVAVHAMDPPDEPLQDVVGKALTQCLAESEPGCGCEVIAIGSVLMVPREQLAYATGISVRVRATGLGLDGFLVAEELADGRILLRDLSGAVGLINRSADDRVSVQLRGHPEAFTGTKLDVGYRRGRLAQRVYAKSADGQRISLLIGFDPDELAEFAGAWLAWPPDA